MAKNDKQEPRTEDFKGGIITQENVGDQKLPAVNLDAGKSAVAVVDETNFDDLLAGDASLGKESIKLEDMAIPRLSVLQPLSPQVLEGKSEFIEGAKAGMIFDSVSKKVYSGANGFRVIPVSFRRAYIEWVPRNAGGGFVADHGGDATVLERTTRDEKTGALMTKEGHEIVVTYEYYVYVYNDADSTVFQAVLSMAKTQAPKARAWNTIINQLEIESPAGSGKMINPAMFYRSYVLKTKPEQNDSGMWFGWVIDPSTVTPELKRGRELYLKCRQFYKDIAEGKVKVAAPVEMGGNGNSESDDDPM